MAQAKVRVWSLDYLLHGLEAICEFFDVPAVSLSV